MRAEVSCVFFGAFQDGDEDRGQLITFLPQPRQLGAWNNVAVHQQFKPVGGFIQFAEGVTALGDELGFASCPAGFAVIRAD